MIESRTLVLAPMSRDALERLERLSFVDYEPWLESGALVDPEELGDRLGSGNFDSLIIEADFVFEETLARAPALRFIGVCRGEVGPHVDMPAAGARGVVVTHTPARNAVAVAELTVALMLALARRLPAADRYVHAGEWRCAVDNLTEWQGVELAGRTAGLIGCGAVGQAVARRLAAFDMAVMAYDPPLQAAGGLDEPAVAFRPLGMLLAQSDFVSLHAPLTPQTRGMIGPAELYKMRRTAYLVNTARAALVDEPALLAALRVRHIAGAALDVHLIEPLPPRSPWLGLDNVILTPHIGGAAVDVVRRHSEMIVEEFERWRRGEPLRHQVLP